MTVTIMMNRPFRITMVCTVIPEGHDSKSASQTLTAIGEGNNIVTCQIWDGVRGMGQG